MKYIASCSFGKDSIATILLAKTCGEPLDEAVYCEVMFDKDISGEVPEHGDFIYGTAIPALEDMGVKVIVLRSEQTYVGLFTGRITRGPKKGMLRSFPICGRCAIQRDCKLAPIRKYQKTLPPDTVQYIGIAQDEQERLLRLTGTQVSRWTNTVIRNRTQSSSARRRGCFLLSMRSPTVAAAGSAPTQNGKSSVTSTTTIRTCGRRCWSCKRSLGKYRKSSTGRSASPISITSSGVRTPKRACPSGPLKEKGAENDTKPKI